MGYRMERYQKRKLVKKNKRKHRAAVILVVIIFMISLNTVDESFRNLLCVDNTRLFEYKYDDRKHSFHFMGQNLYVSQESIDNIVGSIKTEVMRLIRVIEELISK